MYQDTITLFNRKTGSEGDTWYPTVLHNVHLNVDKSAILAKYGPDAKDNAALHVRYTVQDDEKKMVGHKPWLPPNQWQNAQDPAQAVTFAGGDKFDFFWQGDWGNEIPVRDADYASEGDFYTHMKLAHDFVFAISSVGGPYSVIPHFEIVGR